MQGPILCSTFPQWAALFSICGLPYLWYRCIVSLVESTLSTHSHRLMPRWPGHCCPQRAHGIPRGEGPEAPLRGLRALQGRKMARLGQPETAGPLEKSSGH